MKKPKSLSIVAIAAGVSIAFVVLPIGALYLFEYGVTSYNRGDPPPFGMDPPVPLSRVFHEEEMLFRQVNRALVFNPASLVDASFLGSIVPPRSSVALALRREGRPIAAFGEVRVEDLGELPPFGSSHERSATPYDPDSTRPSVLTQIDFVLPGGERASLFILRSPDPRAKKLPYSRALGLFLIAILFASEGALCVAFLLFVRKSLGALAAAAGRLGEGDFASSVKAPGVRELDPAFFAFEEMRKKLAALIEKERELERGRRELVANLSHDLRTPVAAIKGYADGLGDGVANTEEMRRRYLGVIKERAARLERMLDELLTIATLDERKLRLSIEEVDAAAFLEAGVEELSISGARITFEGGAAATIRIDPFALRRVLENVVSNSLAHSGKAEPRIAISLRRDGGFAEIRVADDGKGFGGEALSRATERFFRGDPARSGKGAGLGLAIARELVEAMGGSLELRDDGGAVVIMRFEEVRR
jgi:signal transduction histidine kinase